MNKRLLLTLLCIVLAPRASQTQEGSGNWKSIQKTDPLRGNSYTLFLLEGTFLTAPKKPDVPNPMMILRCEVGKHRATSGIHNGHVNGKLLAGYVVAGGVVDAAGNFASVGTVPVEFRLDDGKLQSRNWDHSKDYSAVVFGDLDFWAILYGHMLLHKENTSPQVRKLVLGVSQFLDSDVVIQFDFPESTEVADACGAIWHK